MCTSVIPAVPYLSIGLVWCLVDPGISRGARKLAQTPRITKKNKRTISSQVGAQLFKLLRFGQTTLKLDRFLCSSLLIPSPPIFFSRFSI
jgi:hypothetical protein